MKVRRLNNEQSLLLTQETNFRLDAGWNENLKQLEDETLIKIINPIENYETVRFLHSPYTNEDGFQQTDIWFKFFFLNGSSYECDYESTGLSLYENSRMTKQTTESFFRLEFFKTPNNDTPTRLNRRFVFAKNLSLPLGEKFRYVSNGTTVDIFKPIFCGSNYKNKENMYLFWFQDDSVLKENTLSGDTFYMTAKFYSAKDGSIVDFVKSNLNTEVNESDDMYYKMVINKSGYTYQIFQYDSEGTGNRIGTNTSTFNPIIFYEKK
jgi:hypothetical protein